jgi:hypothetical protein
MTPTEMANLAVEYGLAPTVAAFQAYSQATRTNIVNALGSYALAEAINNFQPGKGLTIVNVTTNDLDLTTQMWKIAQAVGLGGTVTITPDGTFTSLPPITRA